MSKIIIRDYTENDWTYIENIHDKARLNELSLANLSDAFVPLKEAAISEGLFDYTLKLATFNNDIPVGFVAYSENEIAWIYVDTDYSRRGVGSSLIRYAIDQIKHRPINLEVLSGNQPAIKLYESFGFKIIETLNGKMPGNEDFDVTVHCLIKE